LAFFELLPIGTLAGGHLFRWNGIVWGLVSLLVSALTLHTLINPFANALELIGNRSVLALAVGLALYTIAMVGMWLAVHGRGLAGKAAAPSRGSVVALVLVIGLWIATCACGAGTAAWQAVSQLGK
jgi:hypothetical protein